MIKVKTWPRRWWIQRQWILYSKDSKKRANPSHISLPKYSALAEPVVTFTASIHRTRVRARSLCQLEGPFQKKPVPRSLRACNRYLQVLIDLQNDLNVLSRELHSAEWSLTIPEYTYWRINNLSSTKSFDITAEVLHGRHSNSWDLRDRKICAVAVLGPLIKVVWQNGQDLWNFPKSRLSFGQDWASEENLFWTGIGDQNQPVCKGRTRFGWCSGWVAPGDVKACTTLGYEVWFFLLYFILSCAGWLFLIWNLQKPHNCQPKLKTA